MKKLFLLLFIPAALVSCVKSQLTPVSSFIRLDVSSDESVPTKGKNASGTNFSGVHTAFELNGFVDNGQTVDPKYGVVNGVYFDSMKVSRGVSEWTMEKVYNWIPYIDMTFWAVAPYQPAGMTELAWASDFQSCSFKYALPAPDSTSDAVAQKDILFAKQAFNYDGTVDVMDLTFKHALATIRIDVSQLVAGYEITNVEFVGIKSSATCAVSSSVGFTWSNYGSGKTYGQNFVASDFESDVTAPNSDKFFMFIPQTLASDTKIIVSFKNTTTGQSGRLQAGISGKTWEAGKMYTYKILDVTSVLIVEVVDEVESNVKKNLAVRNKGSVTSYMRLLMVGNWVSATTGNAVAPWTETESEFKNLDKTNWVKGSDGFWYLHDPVLPGDYAPDLFETYTPAAQDGRKLELTITVQSVPYSSDKAYAKSIWGDYTAAYLN